MTETITTKISIPSVNNTNATQPIEDSVKEDVPAPKKRRGRPPKKDIVKNSSMQLSMTIIRIKQRLGRSW